jgi:hypothetical protein
MTISQEKLKELETKWQGLVAQELKTDNPILTKGVGLELRAPILSYQAQATHCRQFATAPLSYTLTRSEDFSWDSFQELYQQGVYDFILDPFVLGWSTQECHSFVKAHRQAAQGFAGRIWGLGDLSGLGSQVLHAQGLTRWGAHGVHELGLLIHQFIQWAQSDFPMPGVALAVEMETDFFKSVAKKRALSLMLESVLETLGRKDLLSSVKIIARAPWRNFTAFDCHSNILRNATALSAAYLSGCDVVESLPFDLLIKLDESQRIQAQRLCLTSQLVLQSESKLSEINDPAYGSFTIETLTALYLKEAWTFMQELQAQELSEAAVRELAQKNWQDLTAQFNKRRLVQSGVNDFALPQAHVDLHPRWLKRDHVRLGRAFEELRLRLENKIAVRVALVGTYATLQARANFTKNYFELLGLTVEELVFSNTAEARQWLSGAAVGAWVTSDQLHAECFAVSQRTYIAGKTTVSGCLNIYAGQDVFSELKALAQWIEARGGR